MKDVNKINISEKRDFSDICDMNDENENNPCWDCVCFVFPIGCMKDEEKN